MCILLNITTKSSYISNGLVLSLKIRSLHIALLTSSIRYRLTWNIVVTIFNFEMSLYGQTCIVDIHLNEYRMGILSEIFFMGSNYYLFHISTESIRNFSGGVYLISWLRQKYQYSLLKPQVLFFKLKMCTYMCKHSRSGVFECIVTIRDCWKCRMVRLSNLNLSINSKSSYISNGLVLSLKIRSLLITLLTSSIRYRLTWNIVTSDNFHLRFP
jgi:hypothetical protein